MQRYAATPGERQLDLSIFAFRWLHDVVVCEGECEADGEGQDDTEAEGEAQGDAEAEGEGPGDTEAEAQGDVEGEGLLGNQGESRRRPLKQGPRHTPGGDWSLHQMPTLAGIP